MAQITAVSCNVKCNTAPARHARFECEGRMPSVDSNPQTFSKLHESTHNTQVNSSNDERKYQHLVQQLTRKLTNNKKTKNNNTSRSTY